MDREQQQRKIAGVVKFKILANEVDATKLDAKVQFIRIW